MCRQLGPPGGVRGAVSIHPIALRRAYERPARANTHSGRGLLWPKLRRRMQPVNRRKAGARTRPPKKASGLGTPAVVVKATETPASARPTRQRADHRASPGNRASVATGQARARLGKTGAATGLPRASRARSRASRAPRRPNVATGRTIPANAQQALRQPGKALQPLASQHSARAARARLAPASAHQLRGRRQPRLPARRQRLRPQPWPSLPARPW